MKNHRPPHIYIDNQYYFVTAGTFHKIGYIGEKIRKDLLKELIFNVMSDYKYLVDAWVIFDNHYHIIFKTSSGKLLPKVIAAIHGKSAIEINKIDKKTGRQIWYQYWDYCIRNEQDYWRHFNYVHHNPIKHGYVDTTENLNTYKFSSFGDWVKKKGNDWIIDCFKKYPICDFTKNEDDF